MKEDLMNVPASGAAGAPENLKSDNKSPVEKRIADGENKENTPPPEKNNEVGNANNGVDLSA